MGTTAVTEPVPHHLHALAALPPAGGNISCLVENCELKDSVVHQQFDSIVVGFFFSPQGPEHPNAGKPFTARGFPRHCYLPDSEKGRKVKIILSSCTKTAFHWPSRSVPDLNFEKTDGLNSQRVFFLYRGKTPKCHRNIWLH